MDHQPVLVTQNEFMRRMKDLSAMSGGGMMGFYGEMPNSFNLVVNTAHPLVEKIIKDEEEKCTSDLSPISSELKEKEKRKADLNEAHQGKKDEEISILEKQELESLDKEIYLLTTKKDEILSTYAKGNKQVRQLIDLALLANNMLKGESLNNFVKRSLDLL